MFQEILIFGPLGKKLGKPVLEAIQATSDLKATIGITSTKTALPCIAHGCNMYHFLDHLQGVEDKNLIAFYAVKGEDFYSCFESAMEHGITKHVIGSTAIPEGIINELIEDHAPNHCILRAPNFSVEAILTDWMVEQAAKILQNHQVGILDIHHNKKADMPSGTARMYAESIMCARGLTNEDIILHPTSEQTLQENASHISISSFRLSSIHGEHHIVFAGKDGTITIIQRANSSASFAEGAITALRWMRTQEEPGIYTMRSVLNIS